MGMALSTRWHRTGAAALGIGALLMTVGCGAREPGTVSAQSLAPGQERGGAPVLVSCEPHQRALVRPVVVNGSTVSQVECVTAAPTAAASPVAAEPMMPAQQPVYRPVQAAQPVFGDVDGGRVVQAGYPVTGSARPVQTRQVVYRDSEPVRPKRTVKKSAIIIGSSAGVGAGVGAAVGGKKGALIGAAIGGGSATIWDQITRR